MACVGHNFFCYLRDIDNVPHRSDRAGAPRWPVHATSIKFDDAFFVGQASKADTGVIGIVLGTFPPLSRGIERIASGGEQSVAIVQIVKPIVSGNDDGAFTGGNSFTFFGALSLTFWPE